jgi:hypothetical protein
MKHHEVDRLQIIRKVIEGALTWSQAAEQLDVSERQVGRLCAAVRKKGVRGVIHGLRGKPSNHQADLEALGMAVSAVHDPLWEGFKPGFACEKLEERYGLNVGRETLRKAMIATGAWMVKRERSKHRVWRERCARVGMMAQMDGSLHDWFEGRGPRCWLLLAIDDATSALMHGVFAKSEDTLNIMGLVWGYIERRGRPVSFYVDKDSIYRTNRQASVEEELRERQPDTQFKRAVEELGIKLIWAHSPQAKGRIERSFETHQDRLIKELRLAGISDIAAANRYLAEVYIPRHNARYAIEPREPQDAHRPLLAGQRLERILSFREERTVRSDNTVQFKRRYFQILAGKPKQLRPGRKVLVETRLDGSVHLLAHGAYLPFKALENRPYRPYYEVRITRSDVRPLASKPKPGKKRWLWHGWFGKKDKPVHDSNNELNVLEPAFLENLGRQTTITATP